MSKFLETTIAVDIETVSFDNPEYALQAYRHNGDKTRIRAVSYAWYDSNGLHTHSKLDPTNAYLDNFFETYKDRRWVAWNTCFDVSWFLAAGLPVDSLKWLDAMLLWRHYFIEPEPDKGKRKSYALAAAMKEYFPDHAGFKDFTDFQTTDPEQLKGLLNRNRMDAAFTLRLADMFWEALTDSQRVAALIEANCIPAVAATYNRGIRIDTIKAQQLKTDLTKVSDDIYAELLAAHPEVADVDLGSPKQLGDLLFNQWGLKSTKQTAKGADSTGKEALADLADIDPRARQLRQYREAVGNCTKYVDSPLASVDYNADGCTRPQAKIFGTYTGRMTYYSKQGKGKSERPTGIALHQWPRDKRYRSIICPPEGYSLLEFDFAGQEFRWMAVASDDNTMLELCASGEDAHAYMGAMVTGQDYRWLQENAGKEAQAKADRNLGKFCNLSFQYRIGAKGATVKAKTQYGLVLEENFTSGLISTYKRSYPFVPRYWDHQIYETKVKGYAETYAGRRVQLSGVSGWERDSTAINYPIQGSGADQKYLGLACIRNILTKYSSHMYFELHDGIYVISPPDKAPFLYAEVKRMLSDLPYRQAWNKTFPIRFPVDGKVGTSWGDMYEPDWD